MTTFMQCKKCGQIRGGLVVRGCRHSWEEREQSQLVDISVGDCGTVYGYCFEVRYYREGISVPVCMCDNIETAYSALKTLYYSNGEVLRYARHSSSKSDAPWITAGVVYKKVNGEMMKCAI